MTIEEELVDIVLPTIARIVRELAYETNRPELNDAARAGIMLAVNRIESLRLDPGVRTLIERSRR